MWDTVLLLIRLEYMSVLCRKIPILMNILRPSFLGINAGYLFPSFLVKAIFDTNWRNWVLNPLIFLKESIEIWLLKLRSWNIRVTSLKGQKLLLNSFS